MPPHTPSVLVVLLSLLLLPSDARSYKSQIFKRHGENANSALNELKILEEIFTRFNGPHDIDYSDEDIARKWVEDFDKESTKQSRKYSLANWNYVTNITEHNERIADEAEVQYGNWLVRKLPAAKKFQASSHGYEDKVLARKLKLIVYGNNVPSSEDKHVRSKLASIGSTMQSIFSTTQVDSLDGSGKKLSLEPDLENILAQSTNSDELLFAWQSWYDAVGPQIKPHYIQFVSYMNQAAQEYGMADVGISWRISDFEDENIGDLADDLWKQIKPLYEELHAYVRFKLRKVYPHLEIRPNGPIPAHLLGNMWAQQWHAIYRLVAPYPDAANLDITEALKSKYTEMDVFKAAETFFESIGLEPMTQTFWDKSMLLKPKDRQVVCHGAADDLSAPGDYRIKMCTELNQYDFQTVHHEMGHIEYYMQYRHQPSVFRAGADAAFHEAIGDTIALSAMSTNHLMTLGLLKGPESGATDDDVSETDLNYLMMNGLEKIAFLPFGYLLDKWRWDVFSGKTTPNEYNKHFWDLRLEFQGVVPPVERTEEHFDPGAKYHVPSNTPYLRYFFARFGQFQFHQAMCKAKKHKGPLFKCDIYQSKEAGDLLKSMMQLGKSRPWPDAMEVMTGQREYKADAMFEYYQPLFEWLKKENKKNGVQVGWE